MPAFESKSRIDTMKLLEKYKALTKTEKAYVWLIILLLVLILLRWSTISHDAGVSLKRYFE
jgi:hypothetical protein